MPWLERVYQAGALWDALEMGAPADVHCYTPAEFERKRVALRRCGDAVEHGLDLRAVDRAAAQLIATIRSIGSRARSAISGRDLDLVDAVAQRVAQLRQRDHLHEAAVGRLVGGDELGVGRGLAQRVEHPGLGRDDRGARRGARSARSASIPPVESMCTPSASTSPAATYSITLVEQPHSGWIRKSAPGCAARTALMSSGLIPAWTWHSPSHTCIGAPERLLDVGAEEHVGAEQDLGVRRRARGRCARRP